MKVLEHTSLGEKISKRMSVWVLILTTIVTTGIITVSYLLSKQMFNQQVEIWNSATPQYALSNLIDSDHFSIQKEIKFLESTGLFSSFVIMDNQKRVISQFGLNNPNNIKLIPIQDEGNVTWGYYGYTTNFYKYFFPFLISGIIFASLVLLLYLFIRWRIKSDLDIEFFRFNQFLNEIELVTEKLNEIYSQDENQFQIEAELPQNNEQAIINRAVSKLLNEIKKANKSLRDAILKSEQKKFEEELTKTALQVTHDIGSPLAVLETIVQSSSHGLPEESRISLRNASSRIRDIANSLLKKAKREMLSTDDGALVQQNLFSVISQVIAEKRFQYQSKENITIDFKYNQSAFGLFSIIKLADFSRILSNLINNSVEAINKQQGCVSISLSKVDNFALITIEDNGKGIPAEILAKLGILGVTYGKENGLGLGFYHAKEIIETCGGTIKITSQLHLGTVVEIKLPITKAPSWFINELKICDQQDVVIIDDDESIHDVWKVRFKEFQNESSVIINLYHFHSPEEFTAWKKSTVSSCNSILYLCDYEFLGSAENGIDLILKFKINYLSVLVTSRFNSEDLTSRCEASGIKLLSKDMASIVPIVTA